MSLAIEMNQNYKHTQNSLLSVVRAKDRYNIIFYLNPLAQISSFGLKYGRRKSSPKLPKTRIRQQK